MIPLRQLYLKYLGKPISQLAWTSELTALFERTKKEMISPLVLARYDSAKPTFLKTDCSALGMTYVIMQPEDSEVARLSSKTLEESGVCDFDSTLDGPRLKPTTFGSRKCTTSESNYRSIVGEIATGRWAMAENKVYIWGAKFHSLCDMKSIHKILEYDGHTHMLCRYSQEMLVYNFTCIHRPSTMMRDVDVLSRMHDPLVAAHLLLASQLKGKDAKLRPEAYSANYFDRLLAKCVYSVRKGEQKMCVDETVQSLSHTLMRSNITCVKDHNPLSSNAGHDAKPAHVLSAAQEAAPALLIIKCELDSVNYDYGMSSIKRTHNEDISTGDTELECNKVCFTCVHTISTTKIEHGSKISINARDHIAFYIATTDESFAYDDTCIMKNDGIQDFLQSYQKTCALCTFVA